MSLLHTNLKLPFPVVMPSDVRPWAVIERRICGNEKTEKVVSAHFFYDAAEKAVKIAYESAEKTLVSMGGRRIFSKEAVDGHFYRLFYFPEHNKFLGVSFMMENTR